MRKKLLSIALIATVVASLTGCGEPFTCDWCGEESTGKKYTSEVWGEKVTVCEDCYKELKEVYDAIY